VSAGGATRHYQKSKKAVPTCRSVAFYSLFLGKFSRVAIRRDAADAEPVELGNDRPIFRNRKFGAE